MTARFARQSALALLLGLGVLGVRSDAQAIKSMDPLVAPRAPSQRPLGAGKHYFVEPAHGDDASDGSQQKPWRRVAHALAQLQPGDTLVLRGGTYYENVRIASVGRPDAPITVRGYPGETAVIDGGLPEFFNDPTQAWEPVAGTDDEYRSTARYGNIRYAHGSFGDSLVGLHTYYHAQDLRAKSELWRPLDPDAGKTGKIEMAPVYCGPGLWYDSATGRIHARLAHTHLEGITNYAGPTDPRKLPLAIAPAHAVPLTVEGAKHVRIQDLTIRNGGLDAVVLQQVTDVEIDDCTVWCASNGLRGNGAFDLRILGCGFHGNLPPWTFRAENSLRHRIATDGRDITRLNTHALLVVSANRESDVYAFPQNDNWEIAYCDFTDAHDGVYIGGLNIKFHHNDIRRLHDDGMYLSPMYPSYRPAPSEVHVYENLISECLTAAAFGGPELRNTDRLFIYRNRFLLDSVVPTARPAAAGAWPGFTPSKPMGDHGSPPWSQMYIYHNTFRVLTPGRSADQALAGAYAPDRPRYLFNNVIEVVDAPASIPAEIKATFAGTRAGRFPPIVSPPADQGASDGNLYWIAGVDAALGEAALVKYKKSPEFTASAAKYAGGFNSRSVIADPQLDADDRPTKESPAVDAGAPIPAEWPDPARAADAGKPDIGALPLGASALEVGRSARKR